MAFWYALQNGLRSRSWRHLLQSVPQHFDAIDLVAFQNQLAWVAEDAVETLLLGMGTAASEHACKLAALTVEPVASLGLFQLGLNLLSVTVWNTLKTLLLELFGEALQGLQHQSVVAVRAKLSHVRRGTEHAANASASGCIS